MTSRIVTLIAASLLAGGAYGQTCTPADSQACRNMKAAEQGYKTLQEERNKAKMKDYQEKAGNYVPGPLDKKVLENTYVSPCCKNGSLGVTGTMTTK